MAKVSIFCIATLRYVSKILMLFLALYHVGAVFWRWTTIVCGSQLCWVYKLQVFPSLLGMDALAAVIVSLSELYYF